MIHLACSHVFWPLLTRFLFPVCVGGPGGGGDAQDPAAAGGGRGLQAAVEGGGGGPGLGGEEMAHKLQLQQEGDKECKQQ